MIARLLFSSRRARPNFQVCVAFLYTRVKHSTKQDYKKLARVIYQLFAKNHSFTIDSRGRHKWKSNLEYGCILYAVHPDCKSHTGAYLTFGHGSILSLSSKQKITTRSSTEAELLLVQVVPTIFLARNKICN